MAMEFRGKIEPEKIYYINNFNDSPIYIFHVEDEYDFTLLGESVNLEGKHKWYVWDRRYKILGKFLPHIMVIPADPEIPLNYEIVEAPPNVKL